MKTFSAILLLLASVGFGDATNFCAPQPKSCTSLPQSSAKACSSLISKSKLRLTTCSLPKSTVTKTSTIQPTTTKTVTATQTVSSIGFTNVQRTILKTVTSTIVAPTTLVQTSTSTAETVVVVPGTTTRTLGITVTTVTTENIPYQQETCAPEARALKKGRRNYKVNDVIPRDCSCYLTSTTRCAQPTTTWTTVTKPASTILVTKSKVTTITVYSTKTLDKVQTTLAVATAASTATSIVTQAITVTKSTTSTVFTDTTTTTSFAVATETVQAGFCDNLISYTDSSLTAVGAREFEAGDTWTVERCCYRCTISSSCLFWRYRKGTCRIYGTFTVSPCITDKCPNGRAVLELAPGDDATYGPGPCAAGVP